MVTAPMRCARQPPRQPRSTFTFAFTSACTVVHCCGHSVIFVGGPKTGNNFLVLLTDGAETCAPDQQEDFVNTTVITAAAVGIRTFVIGAPGSEGNRAFLSRVAFTARPRRARRARMRRPRRYG
jgi:hypothetical protein